MPRDQSLALVEKKETESAIAAFSITGVGAVSVTSDAGATRAGVRDGPVVAVMSGGNHRHSHSLLFVPPKRTKSPCCVSATRNTPQASRATSAIDAARLSLRRKVRKQTLVSQNISLRESSFAFRSSFSGSRRESVM